MWRCDDCGQIFDKYLTQCPNCGSWKSLRAAPQDGSTKAQPVRTRGGLISARELATMDKPSMSLSPEWQEFFGSLPSRFGVLLFGPAGSGKSHFLLRFAAELARHGNVLYVASESGQSNATISMLQRLEVYSSRIFISSAICQRELLEDFATCGARFVIVDSLTCVPDLTLVALSELAEKHRVGIAFSLHCNKDGNFKGGSQFVHWVDVVAAIEDGCISLKKNRFGPLTNAQLHFGTAESPI